MAFSQEIKDAAWRRAGGRCECRRTTCRHTSDYTGRCTAPLAAYGWDAHHVQSQLASGADTLANCEALCLECHKQTHSYGRS